MHVSVHVHVCVVTCLSPPHLHPSSIPPELLPHTWPHPAHPCRACRKKKGMRRGTVFHHCGGQSLRIRQPGLGPSPLGSGAQQAPLQPPIGRRPLKWAPRLQPPETCLCPVAAGGHWWLTPSLCLWTCHARDAELQLREPSQGQQKTATLCQKVSRCQRCLLPSETRKNRDKTNSWLHQLLLITDETNIARASVCGSQFGSHVCMRRLHLVIAIKVYS